jgi:serine phosphatase RsbU (regulator of sigma subunit)
MEIQIAVAKVNKSAAPDSGDTLEVVERPGGGLSVVLADGRSSGHGTKTVSMLVVRRVISLLAEGVRDGDAARATSDYLFSEYGGKASSALNILSVDLSSQTIVLTRNNEIPIYIARGESSERLEGTSPSLGAERNIKPVITEIPIQPGLTIVLSTDGLANAGLQHAAPMDVSTTLRGLLEDSDPPAQVIADALLAQAMQLDNYRPEDDMSVVVMRVMPHKGDEARRMSIRVPIL